MGKNIPSAIGLERILDEVTVHKRVAILAADEIERVYSNPEIRSEFHTLATKYSTNLFVADSGSKVRAMIERKGHEPKLRRWFPSLKDDLPQSLNEDKLHVQELWPFDNRFQYIKYLEGRNSLTTSLVKGNTMNDDTHSKSELNKRIDGMHTLSGGRLRAMQHIGEESTFKALPPADSAEYFVLEKLAREQAQLSWDPFNTASVSENDILQWISEWKATSRYSAPEFEVDLSSLLDANILVHSKLTGKYTFGKPDFYLRMRDLRPRVFISLAWDDRNHPAILKLRDDLDQRGAHVVICTDRSAQHAMSKYSLEEWMAEQARARAGHNVIVVLSDNYVARAAVQDSGVRKEISCVVESLSKDSAVNEHIIAVGLDGKFNELWKSNELIKKLAHTFVYPLQQNPVSVSTIVERVFGSVSNAINAATPVE